LARFLAIDADAHGLYVAAATLKGGGAVAVEHALADETATLTLTNAAELGGRLKALLREAGVRPAPVLLCVGRDRVIPKAVRHPPTPPAEEPAVVRFQAVRDLTENPDDVVMDYTPIGEPTAGERQALAVFVRKQAVQAARQFCEAAGLRLAAVTPRPFAALAAARHAFATGAAPAPDDPSAAIAVVTLWDRGGEFTVARGGELTFSRPIPAHALSDEQALVAALKRDLAVYAGQNPAAPVEAVYLAEPDEPGIGWAGRVRAALNVPVYAFDPLAGSAAAGAVPPPLRGRFAGPVGLLAARSASATLPINFVQPRQPRAEAGPARARVLIGALAALLLLGSVGALAFLEMEKAGRKVRTLTAERNDLDARLKALEMDGKRLAAADQFASQAVNVLDEMYDLADRIPDVRKVSVTEFDLSPVQIAQVRTTRPGQPAATAQKAANTPPPPVANLKVIMRTTDPMMALRVVEGFTTADKKYYSGVKHTLGGTSGRNVDTSQQQITLTAQVMHRKPGEYARQLRVQLPSRQAEADPEVGDGDLDGGFGGFQP
jgi:hypothetical protein